MGKSYSKEEAALVDNQWWDFLDVVPNVNPRHIENPYDHNWARRPEVIEQNYDKEGNLKESLQLNLSGWPIPKYTKENVLYYTTVKDESGKNIPSNLSDETWQEKLPYPFGKKRGNLSDYTFASWFFNQAPSQIAPVVALKTAKPQTQFIHMSGGRYEQNLKIPINPQGISNAAALSRALNKGSTNISQSQGLLSGVVAPVVNALSGIQTKGAIEPQGRFPKGENPSLTAEQLGLTDIAGFGGKDYSFAYEDASLLKDASSESVTFNTVSPKHRDKILSNTPAAIEYRSLVKKYEAINKDAPSITIGQKKDEVKVTPASLKEFETDAVRLKELKTELGLPSPGVFTRELGAFIKDGQQLRLGSKGYLKPKGGVEIRLEKQRQIPTTEQFDPLRPKWGSFMNSLRQEYVRKAGLKKPEKDHMVRLENQLAILGKTLDKDNNFINRPPEFMNKVAGELHKQGFSLGDQNLNFLQMSEKAHRTGKYSRHIISQELTDAEFPHSYLEADQIQVKLKDGTEKWLDVEVLDLDKGSYRLKDGDNVVSNKLIQSKGNYKFGGKIYEKGQRQGLSLTTRMILASIDNPQDLAAAYMMFATDAGAHEIMTGIQTAASFIYDDASELDPLTLEIREKNIPNMIKFLDYALETPQFKGDKVYTDLRNRFIKRGLEENMQDFMKDIRERG